MGIITWAIAVVALLLGASALYIQVTAAESIDFSQCITANSDIAADVAPGQTTCTGICGSYNKRCVMGLQRHSEQNTLPINLASGEEINDLDSNSQENLISCDEPASFGTVSDENEVESTSFNCICCS